MRGLSARFIYNNVLNRCAIGIEIKDLSNVLIINNVITGNGMGLNAYQKKQIFWWGICRGV